MGAKPSIADCSLHGRSLLEAPKILESLKLRPLEYFRLPNRRRFELLLALLLGEHRHVNIGMGISNTSTAALWPVDRATQISWRDRFYPHGCASSFLKCGSI